MKYSHYTLSKLLPLVLLGSCMSMASVYVFRFIAIHPLYLHIAQQTHFFVPALIAIPLLVTLFYIFAAHLKCGLPHVILEFHIGDGRLPFLNFIFQFFILSP